MMTAQEIADSVLNIKNVCKMPTLWECGFVRNGFGACDLHALVARLAFRYGTEEEGK